MNIAWKSVELADKELIRSYYRREQSRNCEYTFSNNFLWAPHYDTRFAVVNGMLVFLSGGEDFAVSYPIGDGDLKKTIDELMTYFEERKKKFRLYLVSPAQFEKLEKIYPEQFDIEYDRDTADYVYEAEKLITLSGKKLHAKRNHINKFKEEHSDWRYERITDDNEAECIRMAEKWCELNGCADDPEKKKEICVTLNALKYRKELELTGGLIRAEGQVIAFCLGEEGSKDTFVVHIEKAFADIQGAYPMINQQFVEHEASGYTYVNREEDTGAEGLRKAKLSYRPVFLLEKGLVTRKSDRKGE